MGCRLQCLRKWRWVHSRMASGCVTALITFHCFFFRIRKYRVFKILVLVAGKFFKRSYRSGRRVWGRLVKNRSCRTVFICVRWWMYQPHKIDVLLMSSLFSLHRDVGWWGGWWWKEKNFFPVLDVRVFIEQIRVYMGASNVGNGEEELWLERDVLSKQKRANELAIKTTTWTMSGGQGIRLRFQMRTFACTRCVGTLLATYNYIFRWLPRREGLLQMYTRKWTSSKVERKRRSEKGKGGGRVEKMH